jgi:hypothetical protein
MGIELGKKFFFKALKFFECRNRFLAKSRKEFLFEALGSFFRQW